MAGAGRVEHGGWAIDLPFARLAMFAIAAQHVQRQVRMVVDMLFDLAASADYRQARPRALSLSDRSDRAFDAARAARCK